jgi:hypothetical protein
MKTSKTVDFSRSGYGQWTVTTTHYGKEIKMHFTDAPTYDLIICQERGYKRAIKGLRSQIINANK